MRPGHASESWRLLCEFGAVSLVKCFLSTLEWRPAALWGGGPLNPPDLGIMDGGCGYKMTRICQGSNLTPSLLLVVYLMPM